MIFMLFFDSILSVRLIKLGVSENKIGLVFGLASLIYMISSPLVGILCKYIDKRFVMLLAYIVSPISLFLFGPSKFFNLPDKLNLLLAGISLCGLSVPLIVVPLIPELIDAVKDKNDIKDEV